MSTQVPCSIEEKRVQEPLFLDKCGTEDPENESDNKLSTEKSSIEAQEDRADILDKQRKIFEPAEAFLELNRSLQTTHLNFDNCLYLGNISVRANKKDIVSLLLTLGELLCFEILIKDKQFRFQSGIAVFRDSATVKSALEAKPFVVFKRKVKISDLPSRNNSSTLLTILVRKASQAAAEGSVPFQTSKDSTLEAPQKQGSGKCCSSQDGPTRELSRPLEKHMAGKISKELVSKQMLRLDVTNCIRNQVSPQTESSKYINHDEFHAVNCVKNTEVMRAGLRRSREHETSDCFTADNLLRKVNNSARFGEPACRHPLEVGRFGRKEFLDKPTLNVQVNHHLENLRFNPRVFSHRY